MSARHLKKVAMLLCIAAASTIVFSSVAQACARAALPAAASQQIPTKGVNQDLFNQAILDEVNYYRCKAGLAPVEPRVGLIKVAGIHANWMAKKKSLTHRSTIRGQSSVQERVLSTGIPASMGSENIGYLPRYQFDVTRKIYVRNKKRCEFTTTAGKRITPHTYATLATEIVKLWMKSPGHRKNLLDQRAAMVGAAVGYDPRGAQCGQFYMAQNFAG